jgi:2-methylcitrate dehydratase PrpD
MMRCIDHPTNVRDGVGWGAPSGIVAAYLASEGFTGAPALTCEDAPEFWSDLGTAWRTIEDTSYKPYPCCRWAHPSIDAIAHLMKTHNLHHSEVSGIDIATFHNATRLAGHRPKTLDEFSYGIAFPVATMIVRGRIGVPELTIQTLSDPEIIRISENVHLIDDPHFTKISQEKRWAQVTLNTKDGRSFQDAHRTPKGDNDQPMSDGEISEKFHLFAYPNLGAARAAEIEALSTNFDALNTLDFTHLLDLCLAAP